MNLITDTSWNIEMVATHIKLSISITTGFNFIILTNFIANKKEINLIITLLVAASITSRLIPLWFK